MYSSAPCPPGRGPRSCPCTHPAWGLWHWGPPRLDPAPLYTHHSSVIQHADSQQWLHTHTHTHMHSLTLTHTHTHTHTHTRAQSHSLTHTHTHTHTHSYTNMPSAGPKAQESSLFNPTSTVHVTAVLSSMLTHSITTTMPMHTHIHTHTRTHAHAHTHTHTHSYRNMPSARPQAQESSLFKPNSIIDTHVQFHKMLINKSLQLLYTHTQLPTAYHSRR